MTIKHISVNNLLGIKYLSKDDINLIFETANNFKEILIKRKQGCKVIFLSPIFKVKKSNYFLNISKFNILTLDQKTKFIALGGIKNNNLNKIKLLNVFGFAGISFFQKKTAPNRGRL